MSQASDTPTLAELARAPYVSLATFRKSGAEVATPVWAAPAGARFYVFSAGDAGKIKRLRNSDRARLAVCDVRGKLRSGWIDARAVLVSDTSEVARALAALHEKYGWQMWLADAGSKLTGRYHNRAYIRIEASPRSD